MLLKELFCKMRGESTTKFLICQQLKTANQGNKDVTFRQNSSP